MLLQICAAFFRGVNFVVADLLNVFEVFLPQLLLYPNASDPLNGDAASMMIKSKAQYEEKVKGKDFACRIVYQLELEIYW